MSGFITRQNLLLLAGVLVLMRFVFLPVLSWQNEKIESVRLKAKQLDKLDSILAGQDAYVEQRVLIDQDAPRRACVSDDVGGGVPSRDCNEISQPRAPKPRTRTPGRGARWWTSEQTGWARVESGGPVSLRGRLAEARGCVWIGA